MDAADEDAAMDEDADASTTTMMADDDDAAIIADESRNMPATDDGCDDVPTIALMVYLFIWGASAKNGEAYDPGFSRRKCRTNGGGR